LPELGQEPPLGGRGGQLERPVVGRSSLLVAAETPQQFAAGRVQIQVAGKVEAIDGVQRRGLNDVRAAPAQRDRPVEHDPSVGQSEAQVLAVAASPITSRRNRYSTGVDSTAELDLITPTVSRTLSGDDQRN
jgi:hypothetical protein